MKILVIRFSSIGDIVLASPVVRCIKQQTNAQVHFITKKEFAFIPENSPYVDKCYSIEKDISEVTHELKKEHYDLIVDLHHNLRSARLKSLLNRRSVSFHKLNLRKWIMVNLKLNILPEVHLVERYFKAASSLGIHNDGKGLDYFIPPKDEVDLHTLPAEYREGYIGFVIGAKHVTKQLPADKIVSIIRKLGQPVVLLGGKEDETKANRIQAELTPHCSVYNACGKYNLNQSASIVKQAKKIISHDTGLMHIAAAFKKEIVSVWGNTIPAFGMYPYYGNDPVHSLRSEVAGLSCRPCSKIGYSKCPKGHFKCMNRINEEEIIKWVQS